MPIYHTICRECGVSETQFAPIAVGPSPVPCPAGHGLMARDYRADRPFIGAVQQEVYSPSLGRMISDQKQVNGSLREIEDREEAATGYRPSLVAHHRTEVPNVHMDEGSQRAVHDGAVKRGEIDAADRLHIV